jgi:hypothetical protein
LLRRDAIPPDFIPATSFAAAQGMSYGRLGNLIHTCQLRMPDDHTKNAVVTVGHRRYVHQNAVVVPMRFMPYPAHKVEGETHAEESTDRSTPSDA